MFLSPLFAAASEIPHVYACFTGTGVAYVKRIHDRYESVVRIGPNSVSFDTATAIRHIYGRRPGKRGYAKDPDLYIMPPSGAAGIGESDDVNHARQRRYLAPAFSEKELNKRQYLI
ncbi:sterigmatocystin biosynthesis monooxygenase stcF [Rasamsonia emersonii CBS 393.64]|uniref:Sterigmatocystin biosynthesis monooxygenase stcF n=1 Tax=Rasamsonia emersonii (strain ATCC 16479 / CBS 393.64 / IMI 116815) TaxID=1408163 RepID=A0A0F4Z0W6_RASE3|nr:sterigmatocystin biosynthesis monooxygenase stcF [Rasamsonia emersonii CBS 393.64]KKA23523.1 sterigmatocystin biosynthesis monooxygenase stcF [Rasamsonia emersonii CBS 393.64]